MKIWHGEDGYIVSCNNELYLIRPPLKVLHLGKADDLILYPDEKEVDFNTLPDSVRQVIIKITSA